MSARPFALDVPPQYAGAENAKASSPPAPLLLALHGYGASGENLASGQWDLATIARERGAFVAHPDGTVNGSGHRFWNATDACCDFGGEGLDDVAYLTAVIDDVAARYPIDPKRVWIAGISNGGFMAHRLACERADKIAAIVSFAGASWKDPSRCTPSGPVSVLEVHALGDPTVFYDGGAALLGTQGAPYPSVDESVAESAAKNGCNGALVPLASHLGFDAQDLDAACTASGWTGCPPGIDVERWTMPGTVHIPRVTRAWSEAVVAWLERHSKK